MLNRTRFPRSRRMPLGAAATPMFRATLSSVRGDRDHVRYGGRLTPHAIEALIDHALHLGGHCRLDLVLDGEKDRVWLEGRLARLDLRGVKAHVQVDSRPSRNHHPRTFPGQPVPSLTA